MIICFKCGKEIKERPYAMLQAVLGDINNPCAVDPGQPIHDECLRKNIDNLALTNEEKKQALEVLR